MGLWLWWLWAGAQTLSLEPKAEVIVYVVAPQGMALEAGSSAFLEAAQGALQQRAHARILSVEQAGLDTRVLAACPVLTRLGCWAQRVHDRVPNAQALVVMSVQPRPDGQDMLTAQFIYIPLVLKTSMHIDYTRRYVHRLPMSNFQNNSSDPLTNPNYKDFTKTT